MTDRETYKDLIRIVPETGQEIIHWCQMGTEELSWFPVEDMELALKSSIAFTEKLNKWRREHNQPEVPPHYTEGRGCSICHDIRRNPEILERLDIRNIKRPRQCG